MDYFTFNFSSRRPKRFDYLEAAQKEAEKNSAQTIIIEGKQMWHEIFGKYIKSEQP